MNKKIFKWLLVDLLIVCGAVALVTVCRKVQEGNSAQSVQSTEQTCTSQSQ